VNETAVGFLILGTGILAVLVLVFAITIRTGGGAAGPRPTPPPGVHLPPGSLLPVIFSIGAALLGAGLTFKPDEPYPFPVIDVISGVMQPLLGMPGIVVLLYGIWAWVRAAGHEWHETEAGSSHDGPGH
jgi:hypothetical protein